MNKQVNFIYGSSNQLHTEPPSNKKILMS